MSQESVYGVTSFIEWSSLERNIKRLNHGCNVMCSKRIPAFFPYLYFKFTHLLNLRLLRLKWEVVLL